MVKSFRSLFNIYPGEERHAAWFVLLGFVWSLAITAGLKFSDALFLIHVGAEQLPVVYGISACTMIVLASFLLYAFHHFDTHQVCLGIIATSILAYSFMFVCFKIGWGDESQAIWFILRIMGTVFFATFMMSYWTFVDQYYTLQDAKRLFSLFSSSIFLGIATTGTVMQLGILEFETVLACIVCLLSFVAFWMWTMEKKMIPVHDENSLQESASQGDLSFSAILKMITGSPFTLLLMASNFTIFILNVVTEYNYLSAFEDYFPPQALMTGEGEQEPLTLFLGKCILGVSISNLFIGLFVYSRIIKRYGLSGVLPLTAILLMVNYMGWLAIDGIFFAVVGIFVVEGSLYVIDDSNFNLLLNAVNPRLKYRVRIVIESFFEPVGMLLSSFLLTWNVVDSRVLGLCLAILMFILALALSYFYAKAIYQNLTENAILFNRKVKDWLSPSLIGQLMMKIDSGTLTEKVMATSGILASGDRAHIRKLLEKAEFMPLAYKVELVHLIKRSEFADDPEVLEALYQWYDSEKNPQVEEHLYFNLASAGLIHPEKALQYLESDNIILRSAAIVSLKKSWAHLTAFQASDNRGIAMQYQRSMLESTNEEEVLMGITLVGIDGVAQDAELLVPLLKNPNLKIATKAMETFAKIADSRSYRFARLLHSILHRVSDSDFKNACLVAYGKVAGTAAVEGIIEAGSSLRPNERHVAENVVIEMGLRTVPILLSLTRNEKLQDKSRILAVRILSRLARPQLRANLMQIITPEIRRAYFYFLHAQTLPAYVDGINLQLLKETLETSYRQIMDFIIHLLGEAGEIEDSELLARCLVSRNAKTRSQVVETLERSSSFEIYRLLYPLLSDIPTAEKIAAAKSQGIEQLALPDLLMHISQSSSPIEGMIAAVYLRIFKLPQWKTIVFEQMQSHKEIFHRFAYELLEP